MSDIRTTVTELVTGIGMLGYPSLEAALDARPPEMVSVAPETWDLLRRAFVGGAMAFDFRAAFANGQAFLEAAHGLRGRRPIVIEWKGSHRAPGDEVVPIDLRIDHVFLVSCKYLSKIMINASPTHLFERLLQGAHGLRSDDWYGYVAGDAYQDLYAAVRHELRWHDLPATPSDLSTSERKRLGQALRGGWPGETKRLYRRLADVVSVATATRWETGLGRPGTVEPLLWRLLRIGSAPYFVLGAAPSAPLRIRVGTPWDWRVDYRLSRFHISPQHGGQPRVRWEATVLNRHSGEAVDIRGHVEVRWSHGRFGGSPEAKVYLDTPHADVPGYYPLEP